MFSYLDTNGFIRMDPFEADKITPVAVPEPIRSAIYPVEVEEEDANDENELTPGDEVFFERANLKFNKMYQI